MSNIYTRHINNVQQLEANSWGRDLTSVSLATKGMPSGYNFFFF
jgi:hypothetical protein